MDTKEYRDSMKMVCWSLVGMTLMFIAILLSACKSGNQFAQERVDSVYVEKLIPYQLPPDSASVLALLECNEEGKVTLQWLDVANTKNAELKFALDSVGNMKTQVKVQHDTLYVPAKETLVSTDKIIKQIVEVEKPHSWWTRLRIWMGSFALFGSLGWMAWKVVKLKFT